jgi:hypothetical protein
MKHVLLLLVGLMAFVSCQKEDEPAPVASARVSGTYALSRLAYDSTGTTSDYNITLPQSVTTSTGIISYSGTIVVEKYNNLDNAVTITLAFGTTGAQDVGNPVENIQLEPNGSAYNLVYSGQTIGTANGTNITIDIIDGAERFIYEGRRQ